jgi:2'-5' RNA ligase
VIALPTEMRDRWLTRTDTAPGKGVVYWHMLMGRYPEVRELAQAAQERLADFSGLHMTPLDWLHMSTLVVGSTDEIESEQMQEMLESASCSLARVAPISITLGRVLYHPEAIMLGVEPERALDPVLNAARMATQTVTGRDGYTTSGPVNWVPHMTLCYSTARQPASPLIERLGMRLPECRVTIASLSLVVQWGPERQWHWQPVGSVPLDDHQSAGASR